MITDIRLVKRTIGWLEGIKLNNADTMEDHERQAIDKELQRLRHITGDVQFVVRMIEWLERIKRHDADYMEDDELQILDNDIQRLKKRLLIMTS